VEHRARKYGTTKFGWERFINGFLDLTTIMFIGKFGKKPMQFFGLLGTLSFFIGLIMIVGLMISKFLDPAFSLTNRPAFYLSIATMIIGTQLFLSGFVGELVSRSAADRNQYHISDQVGI